MYRSILISMLVTGACGKTPVAYNASTFVLTGSVSPTHTIGFRNASPLGVFASWFSSNTLAASGSGSPSALVAKFYRLYASSTDDCSSLVLVQDYGTIGANKDLTFNPVLFFGSPAGVQFKCLAVEMEDIVTFRPNASALSSWPGVCTDKTMEYTSDLYRFDDTLAWKTLNGTAIAPRGTQLAPIADTIYLYASTSPVQVLNGPTRASASQVSLLTVALEPPTSFVFFADFENRVSGAGSLCHVQNPTFGFR